MRNPKGPLRRPGHSGGPPSLVKRRRPPSWHLALTAALMVAAAVAVLVLHWREQPDWAPLALPPSPPIADGDARALADSLLKHVDAALAEVGIWPELIDKPFPGERGTEDVVRIRVPGDLPLPVANLTITRLVQRHGGEVLRGEQLGGGAVDLDCGPRPALGDTVAVQISTVFQLRRDRSLERRAGRIAIVLDDFGVVTRRLGLLEGFCAIPQTLTLGVLPNEGRPDEISALMRQHGHEVIVHLPMEPVAYPENDPGEGAILVEHDDPTIQRLCREALRRVPGAVGVNNHMGSRATADVRVMEAVLTEVKRHKLFFLDSRTTAESLALATATALEVPCARRDMFLDGDDGDRTVEDQLWDLAALAADQGQAIGVGHDHEPTLLALRSVLPRLESRGFRFVPVSQLVQ